MSDLLITLYPWTKSLHIVSVISWMAGLLYLPRLFVYHCAWAAGTETSEQFKVMERRLLRYIMNPAMIATYLFGAMLVFTPGIIDWSQGWFHARNYRIANEVPTLAMIGIVVMVVVRPF